MLRHQSGVPRRIPVPTISIWYPVLLSVACLWAIFNCAYVYLVYAGGRTYRIESSVLIFGALLLPAALSRRSVTRSGEVSAAACGAIAMSAVALWLAIMVPLLTYPFLSDDYVFLGRYQTWADLWRVQPLFRPLFAFVFWTVASVGHGSTLPFHILALALHLGCAVLVGILVGRIVSTRTAAVVAFAVFLVNPLQLEATLWVSGLQELLCAFFVLSAAVIYSGGPGATLSRAFLATPVIILALLSKETAVGYLLLLPLLDIALGRMKGPSKPVRPYILFGSTAAAYLLTRSRFTTADPDYFAEPSRYFLKQFVTLPYKFFVQPWNAEAIDVPLMVPVALCAAVLIVLLAAALRQRLSRVVLTGPLIVISFSLPLYAYFFVGPDLMAARYLYLPFVGWTLFVADLLTATFRRRAAVVVMVLGIVAGSSAALILNLRPWRTTADAMAVMESAVRQQADPLAAVRAWERERSIRLTYRGSIPIEYQGVYVLLNGYDEFVRFASSPAPATR